MSTEFKKAFLKAPYLTTVELGYLAHLVIWRTSSIRLMSYSCLNSTLHSLSGTHNLIKQ